ncbi:MULTISPECIES: restriction endonuclease [unclassified Sphingomonas]|uniref:restriction endonuclease n=1 Tax=unclassified Sphingomonas TaxID=196159 RepID=UPI0028618B18|nr:MULTISPECIES: restriction endonuclease [unclassified Sphingomonas]MDR6116531.1 restriction system protein [Sphingomonas sp. SORGH_AS_0789]MDR6149793.1 restriction system protein [Sphingomonas sp. SORGH_AS_0742]
MTVALVSFTLVLLIIAWRHSAVPWRHRWRRRQARAMAEQLRGSDREQSPAMIFARLRAMDALAFEELLLESFERQGHTVVRNCRYTGDGGIDGQVVLAGERWLVQAKRYAGPIKPAHVVAFAELCRTRRQRGLFIHTGRTGPASRAACRTGDVVIISGRALLALIRGERLDLIDRAGR